MSLSHYHSLFIAYFMAMLLWFGISQFFPKVWTAEKEKVAFPKPWLEIGFAFIAVVLTILLGQAYMHWGFFPEKGALGKIGGALNQLIIFSPFIGLLLIRKQDFATAWLPKLQVFLRIMCGLIIALISIAVFRFVRENPVSYPTLLVEVYHPQNLSYLVQVLGEDIAIAILFVRIRAAIGFQASILLVAALFAAGHIPAMLANGWQLAEMGSLILDTLLGIGIMYFVARSRDIWWFWMVHFAMDMMQFYAQTS